jgi:hypothetical protein
MKSKETIEEALEKFSPLKYKGEMKYNKIDMIEFAKWQQEKSYSKEEVDNMFDTLKRNSIDNVATIANVDLFIRSWKREFKNK